jgi:hypothetical protein
MLRQSGRRLCTVYNDTRSISPLFAFATYSPIQLSLSRCFAI